MVSQRDRLDSAVPRGVARSRAPGDVLVCPSVLAADQPFRSAIFATHVMVCADPWDYWRKLNEVWCEPTRTLVLIEHDMAATDERVAELAECPHSACTVPYRIWVPRPQLAQHVSTAGLTPPIAVLSQFSARGLREATETDEFCDFSGIGLVKVAPDVRLGPLERVPWQAVETSVHAQLGARWHLHWPEVEHHHH